MNPLRDLPAVNDVLAAEVLAKHPRAAVVVAVREELALLRARLAKGAAVDGEARAGSVANRVAERLNHELRPKLRSVINATGIVLHTNLGRSPTAAAAAQAAQEAACGYLNLELDLGRPANAPRGRRQSANGSAG